MKIDKVIVSSDDNPLYLDFWPIISQIWREIFEIEPVLLYFGQQNPSEKFGIVKKLLLKNDPIYYQTLWSRYWYPQHEPETTFIISDIDMIPMSRKYFIDDLRKINDDEYVHLVGTHRPLPSCYHVAKGKIFNEFMHLPLDFQECISFAQKNTIGNYHSISSKEKFNNWGSDEEFGTKRLQEWSQKGMATNLIDRKPSEKRLDRSNFNFKEHDVLSHHYYDCHSIRPYLSNKIKIDNLVRLIYKSYGKVWHV